MRRLLADFGEPIRPVLSARCATVTLGLDPRSRSAQRSPRSSLTRKPARAARQTSARARGSAASISSLTSAGVGTSTPTSSRRLCRPLAPIVVPWATFCATRPRRWASFNTALKLVRILRAMGRLCAARSASRTCSHRALVSFASLVLPSIAASKWASCWRYI